MFTGNERFTAPALIGKGGMGLVYRARDEEMGCDVALKTFRVPTPSQLVRLKNEFRSLAQISHKNLLGLHELVVAGDSCFFSMELVDGGVDFTSWVTRNRGGDRKWQGSTHSGAPPLRTHSAVPTVSAGYDADAISDHDEIESVPAPPALGGPVIKNPFESRIDLTRLKNATFQLTQGVMALHAAGKLHRDLKPSNVLVDRRGRVVVLDFGLVDTIAHEDDQRDSEHRIIGTVQFMSPEQGWGEPLTTAADWYAVGVMLFEALTGTLPFNGDTRLKILYAKRNVAKHSVRDLANGVPRELDELVMGLLRPKPADRFGGDELLAWASEVDPAGVFTREEDDSLAPPRDLFVPRVSGPLSTSGLMVVLPFVGRQEELARLDAALDSAVRTPVVVHVTGVSGMGKSELVQHWLGRTASRVKLTVLRGRCNPQELIPYKAFDSVVDELWGMLSVLPFEACEALAPDGAAELARLFPVLGSLPGFERVSNAGPADPHEARRKGFGAFRELLVRLCKQRPVVIWIDDVQWGDLDSLRLLAAVLGGVDPPRVCLLLSYRAEDVGRSDVLSRMLSEDTAPYDLSQVQTIRVGALSVADSRALLGQMANIHGINSANLDPVVDDAEGSPFFLSEYVRGVAAATSAGAEAAPARLADLVVQRLKLLDAPSRSTMELAAVAGQSIERSLLLQAAGLGEEGRPVVASLAKLYFLRTIHNGVHRSVEAYHDRIREAVVESMGPGQLAVRHHQIAHAMLHAGTDDPHALVRHPTGAGHPGQAASYAVQAAERASGALAFAQAVGLYETALELNHDPVEVARLHAGLAQALANAGRGRRSGAEFEKAAEALRIVDGDADLLPLRSSAAQQYLQSGHLHEGMRILREVLAAVGVSLPSSNAAKLANVAWYRGRLALRGLDFDLKSPDSVPAEERRRMEVRAIAAAGLSLVDLQLNLSFQAQHLIDALNNGSRHNLVVGLGTESALQAALKGSKALARCDEILTTAQRLAEESGDPEMEAWSALGRGVTAYMVGDWPTCVTGASRAANLFRSSCTGVAWELVSAESYVATALAHSGRMAELAKLLPAILLSANERGDLYADTSLRMGMPSLLWLAQDQGELALDQAEDAITRWPAETFHLQHYLHFLATGHAELYLGKGAALWSRVEAVWGHLSRHGYLRLAAPGAELTYLRARAAWMSGHGSRVGELKKCWKALRKMDAVTGPAYADVVRGLWRRAQGDDAAYASALAQAAAKFDAASMPLHAAGARLRQGEAHSDDVAIRAAEERFHAETVVDADRMARALIA